MREAIEDFFNHRLTQRFLWAVYSSLRLRSFGVIRIRISDPRSVWIMVHQRNR